MSEEIIFRIIAGTIISVLVFFALVRGFKQGFDRGRRWVKNEDEEEGD